MRRDTEKDGFSAQIIDDNLYEWQARSGFPIDLFWLRCPDD
jgi:hypothetical protein